MTNPLNRATKTVQSLDYVIDLLERRQGDAPPAPLSLAARADHVANLKALRDIVLDIMERLATPHRFRMYKD